MTLACHNSNRYTIPVPAPRQAPGREKQRGRTRKALLEAAGRLAAKGKAPTITEVAEAADISRRTAYRYFPTQEQLLTEVGLEHTRPEIAAALEKAASKPDPEVAFDIVVQAMQRAAFRNEALLGTMLQLSLDRRLGQESPGGPVRGGRRVEWIEAALAPLRRQLSKKKFARLVSALTLCVGIEAVVALRDIRALASKESIEVSRWTARALIRAAMEPSV